MMRSSSVPHCAKAAAARRLARMATRRMGLVLLLWGGLGRLPGGAHLRLDGDDDGVAETGGAQLRYAVWADVELGRVGVFDFGEDQLVGGAGVLEFDEVLIVVDEFGGRSDGLGSGS